jgi:hypothetical protein
MPCNKQRDLTLNISDIHLPQYFIYQHTQLEPFNALRRSSWMSTNTNFDVTWGPVSVKATLRTDSEGLPAEGYKIYLDYVVNIAGNEFTESNLIWTGATDFLRHAVSLPLDGTCTITMSPLYLWQTWSMQAPAELASWGYPEFPYSRRERIGSTWTKTPTLESSISSGPLHCTNDYSDRFGGGDSGLGVTNAAVSITLAGETFTCDADIEDASAGALFSLGLTCGLNQRNGGDPEIDGEPTYDSEDPATFTAAIQAAGISDIYYNFREIDWETDAGHTLGTSAGVISQAAKEPNGTATDPYVYFSGVVWPNNPVRAFGRVALNGQVVWPDSVEYPKVKYRPLWKSSIMPPAPWSDTTEAPYVPFYDDESLELTSGTLAENLDLQRIQVTGTHYYTNLGSSFTFNRYADEWDLGIVLEQQDHDNTNHWLTTANQHYESWRVLGQDEWLTKPAKVQHNEDGVLPKRAYSAANWNDSGSPTITYNSPATGDVTIAAGGSQAVFSRDFADETEQWDFSEFRYLNFQSQGTSSFDLTVRVTYETGTYTPLTDTWVWTEHTKDWIASLTTASTLYELDLLAPSALGFTRTKFDTTNWAHDMTTETGSPSDIRQAGQVDIPKDDGVDSGSYEPFVPHAMFGVGRVKKFEILVPANKTAKLLGSVLGLTLKVKYLNNANETDRATLTILPVFQLSDNEYDAFRRWARYDGVYEDDDDDEFWRYHPEGKRLAFTLVNYKEALDVPYAIYSHIGYRHTEFITLDALLDLWDKNSAQDWVITDRYDTDAENTYRLNNEYHAIALCPVKWSDETPIPIIDQDVFTAAFELEARLPADITRIAPGVGDPQGDWGTNQWRFFKELGTKVHGITHDKDTYRVKPHAEITIARDTTALGTLTSNDWGYYRSNPLYTISTDRDHILTSSAMTSTEVKLVQWLNRFQWTSLLGVGAASNGGVSYDVGLDNRHYRAYTKNGTIWLGISTNVKPLAFTDFDTTISATDATIRIDRDKPAPRIYLCYIDGTVKQVYSTNEGSTWSTPVTIAAAGTHSTFEITRDGRRLAYWVDGTAIKGQIYDARDNVMVSTFTAIASGVDDQSIDASESVSSGGIWGVDLLYISSGAVTVKHSTDGQTFS